MLWKNKTLIEPLAMVFKNRVQNVNLYLTSFTNASPIDFRCIYTLIKGGKHREMAILSKLFEGFLDDGPQFVLRLVIVVLYGIGTGKDKGTLSWILIES